MSTIHVLMLAAVVGAILVFAAFISLILAFIVTGNSIKKNEDDHNRL